MRIVVIGGTGHIGTWLIPRLALEGHELLCVSRGQREPYQPHAAWDGVRRCVLDREAEEAAGNFGARIAELKPEVVVDLTCFERGSAEQLVEALRGRVEQFLHCGTIWIHGHSVEVPTTESAPRHPICDYGVKKLAIENYLLEQAHSRGFPATLLHPGHLVGPGWIPLNPAGNFNPQVFVDLAAGREIALPNIGMETVHHVHADDVAAAFVGAIQHRNQALGESFHVVSGSALTLRGYAEGMAAWFGVSPRLRFLPWEEWRGTVSEADALATWDHIAHSPNCSIQKARGTIGYTPRYRSLEAVQEAVQWLRDQGRLPAEQRSRSSAD